jgi:hypothetical protein
MASDLKILLEDINFQRNKESQRQHLKEGKNRSITLGFSYNHQKFSKLGPRLGLRNSE